MLLNILFHENIDEWSTESEDIEKMAVLFPAATRNTEMKYFVKKRPVCLA